MWRLTAERELMSMLSTSLADQVTPEIQIVIKTVEQTCGDKVTLSAMRKPPDANATSLSAALDQTAVAKIPAR